MTTYQQTAKELPKFFHLHMVSDASGETLAAIAKAAAVQYSGIRAIKHSHPFVRNKKQLDRVIQEIERSPGIVLYTIVNGELAPISSGNARRWGLPAWRCSTRC